jgi:hypothetical protein
VGSDTATVVVDWRKSFEVGLDEDDALAEPRTDVFSHAGFSP